MNWTRTHTDTAIIFTLLVLLFHMLVFFDYRMPNAILLGGFGTVFMFFMGLWFFTKIWMEAPSFGLRLFCSSLLIRLFSIVVLYTLSLHFDPVSTPFEISAIDSINYHKSGILVADAFTKDMNVFGVLESFWKGPSDYGFSVIIGSLYYVFGPYPLIIKIFNTLIGSFTVIQIYGITKLIYDEKKARVAGILAMLMPPLLWFGAMVLKETFLIALIVNVGYLLTRVVKNASYKVFSLALIALHLAVMFYFRTFMAPLILICILVQMVFLKTSKKHFRIVSILLAVLLVFGSYEVVNRLGMKESIDAIVQASQHQFENELTHTAQARGITYTKAIIAPLLVAGAIVTPFPSLLDFEAVQLGIFAHFQNEIVRNIMYFFVFFGLLRIRKHQLTGTIFISSFAIGYILVLAVSGVSFQDRFQLLALPFLIIFMADGIVTEYPKKMLHWKIYLAFIFCAVLAWNLFKLSNRNLI